MNANEPICDKDPRGCWSVRCQLGKNCKNTHPAKTIKNLKDGELPVLTVTVLDCNGKLIRSLVSFQETRIICDSLVDELRKAQSNCNGFCGEYECIENQENCKRKAQE